MSRRLGAAVERAGAVSQSLERGLAILASFRGTRPLLGITDLARELDLGTSTTHRYVATLVRHGYLERDRGSRKYRLGIRVMDLGLSWINSMELRVIAAPHLLELSEETGHTVNMGILVDGDVVYVARCRSPRAGQREIDLGLDVGARLPAYCTSMGKVLLAFLAPDDLRELLAGMDLRRRGPNTVTERSALRSELDRVRSSGLAVNDEELAYGLRSIAAPIRGRGGEVAAAINLAVHRSMGAASMDEVVSRLGPPLRRAANAISIRAYGPPLA